MISNALMCQAKPKIRGGKWKTSIQIDLGRQNDKGGLKVPVSTVRHLRKAKLLARSPNKVPMLEKTCAEKVPICQETP